MNKWKLWPCVVPLLAISSHASAAKWVSAIVGANASQVTLTSSSATNVSSGYAGSLLGVGGSFSPVPTFSAEADLLYVQRKFGFNGTKNSFPSIQIPFLAHYRYLKAYGGAGGYLSLWNFDGEVVKGSSTSSISATDAGHESMEFGFVVDLGANFVVFGLPLRADFRRLQSVNDVAKSSKLKGKVVEYQMMVGYNFGVGKK